MDIEDYRNHLLEMCKDDCREVAQLALSFLACIAATEALKNNSEYIGIILNSLATSDEASTESKAAALDEAQALTNSHAMKVMAAANAIMNVASAIGAIRNRVVGEGG